MRDGSDDGQHVQDDGSVESESVDIGRFASLRRSGSDTEAGGAVLPRDRRPDVVGDIARRRGQVTGESQRANAKIIEAEVPLSEMFGYVTDLRSMTQGRGNYVMQFDRYGETPRFIQDEILKKAGVNTGK